LAVVTREVPPKTSSKIARLPQAAAASLEDVQRRRRQLMSLTLVVFVLVVAAVGLFSLAAETFLDKPVQILSFNALRMGFVALAIVFALYVFVRERELARSERALVAAQIRATGLANRLRELSALTQAGKAVSSVLSLDDVLQVVLESARDLLGATEGSVMLFDDEKRFLRIAAAVGLDDSIQRDTKIEIGQGVAGWVAQVREPVILQGDVKSDRFSSFIPKRRPVSSAMSAPLYRLAEPVGVLNVSVSGGDRIFSEHDLQALTVFAEHAAIAIANARLYEKEKTAREKLAEVDSHRREFVATLTHDLKAPLTSILGYSQLLRRGGERFDEADAREFVEVIDRQGRRILDMVERLVVASSLEDGRPVLARERLDLSAIVMDQLESLRGMLVDRDVQVDMPEELPPVYGDRAAIEHIVANLIDNAVKYSGPQGKIRIEAVDHDGHLRVSVIDDGDGIPEELLAGVFDRYKQAPNGGGGASVGLGLFIVRSLAEAHGGRAWAENEPGAGARVSFTLPHRRDDR
jgi:K+-sensing histidine kinase KdpD